MVNTDHVEMYSCCKTEIFAGTTTPKLINTSADKSDQSFLMIWADKSFISSGHVVYFQTVSSHSQKFVKIDVLKNFVKLTGKYLCRSLSLITHRPAALFKTGLRHSCFIVNFVNFFENNIFTEQLRTAASVFMERICNINKPHFI